MYPMIRFFRFCKDAILGMVAAVTPGCGRRSAAAVVCAFRWLHAAHEFSGLYSLDFSGAEKISPSIHEKFILP